MVDVKFGLLLLRFLLLSGYRRNYIFLRSLPLNCSTVTISNALVLIVSCRNVIFISDPYSAFSIDPDRWSSTQYTSVVHSTAVVLSAALRLENFLKPFFTYTCLWKCGLFKELQWLTASVPQIKSVLGVTAPPCIMTQKAFLPRHRRWDSIVSKCK